MNNDEKRKYATDLLLSKSALFDCEIGHGSDYINQIPSLLYKYRNFDQYTFDMLEKEYLYLGPVNKLDDPFDCLNDPNVDEYYKREIGRITEKAVDCLIDWYCPNGLLGRTRAVIKELALECIENGDIDFEKVPKIVERYGDNRVLSYPHPFFIMLATFNENFREIFTHIENSGMSRAIENPNDSVRVCALSELRDNKIMWSLYANKYEGYCVEYKVPKIEEVIHCIYPVIYTEDKNNCYILKVLEYTAAALMRSITNGKIVKNIGAITELFRTKDYEWSFQKEWRIIGNSIVRYHFLKIKAIYLGFKVSEENEKKIIEYAKKKCFGLYKMNKPNGEKTISYTELLKA